MSKRHHSEPNVDRTGKKPLHVPKKHLYLVLDDWHKGFSIHKIDVRLTGHYHRPAPWVL